MKKQCKKCGKFVDEEELLMDWCNQCNSQVMDKIDKNIKYRKGEM